jgi:XTP/dITP diphosphohydrolase
LNCFISSGNKSKASELKRVLEIYFPEVKGKIDVRGSRNATETGLTYAENSKIKSFALHQELLSEGSSAHIIFSDDSGLEVSGLNGEPGIFSARYNPDSQTLGFDANVKKLLAKVKDFHPQSPKRLAKMISHIHVLKFKNNHLLEFYAEDSVEGRIIDTPEGVKGFGYDPIFFYEPSAKTFAELQETEKDSFSHRAKAIAKLCQHKKEIFQ